MPNETTTFFDQDTLGSIEKIFEDFKDDGLLEIVNLAKERFPDKVVTRLENWVSVQKVYKDDCLTMLRRGCKPASKMDNNPPAPKQVWFGMYSGAVSYLAGETGAGKSSALYNIAVHAALNEPLWGIPFGLNRPLKVLYFDPENARLQSAWKIENIGMGKPEGLIVHPADGVDFSHSRWQDAFRHMIIQDKYDLVLLDPLINLFMTINENDNPEGARQIKFLQGVAQESKAAILVVHHMGKSIENGSGGSSDYGRGASSRLASADVGLRWRSRGEGDERDDTYRVEEGGVERNDECRLRITKNRLGRQSSLFLKMAGSDRFDVSSHEAWRGKSEKSEKRSQSDLAIENISDYLINGEEKTRTEIVEMLKAEGIGETNGVKALTQMCERGILNKRVFGKNVTAYKWVENATQQQVV